MLADRARLSRGFLQLFFVSERAHLQRLTQAVKKIDKKIAALKHGRGLSVALQRRVGRVLACDASSLSQRRVWIIYYTAEQIAHARHVQRHSRHDVDAMLARPLCGPLDVQVYHRARAA